MQFEDASRRMRRLALVLATLVALPTLLPTSAAAGTGAARHEQRSELAGRTARSHIPWLACGSGYRQAGGSPAVRTLQRRLTRLGYAPGPVDGRFGPRTRAAVIAFQTRHHLTADGTVGPHTRRRLHALRTTVSRGVGLNRPHGAPRVRSLQRRLQQLGYHPGRADGRFGPHTQTAVTAFQRDHGLARDGIAGPKTYARLRTTQPPSQTPTQRRPEPQPSPAPTGTPPRAPTTAPAPQPVPELPPAGRPRAPAVTSPGVAAENPRPSSVPSLAAVVLVTLAALALTVVVIALLPFLLVSGLGRRRPPPPPAPKP